MKIDNEIQIFNIQNEIPDCSFKEEVDQRNESIYHYKGKLEKIKNEIQKVEELCDCFESIYLCKENYDNFNLKYWDNFFSKSVIALDEQLMEK